MDNFSANKNKPNPQANRPYGRANQPPNKKATISQICGEEVDEEATCHIHAAIEHQGPNQQFSVLQTPAEYEGKKFTLLIDSRSTHSFLSPKCVQTLNL